MAKTLHNVSGVESTGPRSVQEYVGVDRVVLETDAAEAVAADEAR